MRPTLSELPPEALEHILLFLPPVDILRAKQVNLLFQTVVLNSQHLQHRINLFGAGLVDNPHSVFNLPHRQSRLREYVTKWESPETSVRYDYPLNNRISTQSNPFGRDLFVAQLDDASTIWRLTRIPPSPTQGKVEEWMLQLPSGLTRHSIFRRSVYRHSVHSQENLLAVVEQVTEYLHIRLLDLMDGSPHKIPLKKNLSISFAPHRFVFPSPLQISRSRIAFMVQHPSSIELEGATELIVLDWREGEMVLDLSGDDPDFGQVVSRMTDMHFLEEYWLIALFHQPHDVYLVVFDTRQGLAQYLNWRLLQLPRLAFPASYVIPAGHGDPLTVHPEFLVDPAQSNFVIHSRGGWVLVIPVNLITQIMDSTYADPRIQWGDWGEGVIRVNVHSTAVTMQLVDAKMLVLCSSPPYPNGWSVEVYDLSKSGQNNMQVLPFGGGRGNSCRRVLSTPKWSRKLQMGDEIPSKLYLVGNKVVGFYEGSGENHQYLRIWEIGEM